MDMRFCSRCGVPLDEGVPAAPLISDTAPMPVPIGPSAVAVAPAPPEAAAVRYYDDAPQYAEPEYAHPEYAHPEYYGAAEYDAAPPRRRGFLRFLLIGILSGVLVAGALLALEATTRGPGNAPPERIALVRHDDSAAGYSISVPKGWRVRRVTVGGGPAYSFVDPKRTPDGERRRGFNISTDKRPLGPLSKSLEREAEATANEEFTGGLQVGGRTAARLAVTADDLQFDRWWIDNGATTWRIEFYSTFALQEETSVLADRIIDSFQTL